MYNVSPTICRIESSCSSSRTTFISFMPSTIPQVQSVTSTTWHMCTAVVDVHDKMDAVDLGDDITKNHSNVQVTMEKRVSMG